MITKCKNCGTASNYQELGKMENDCRMIQIYTCRCGQMRHQVFWLMDGCVEWENGKIISTTFEKKMLDKSKEI